MLAIVYALVSAVLYGVSDFLSGVQSRRRHFLVVGAVGQTFSAAGVLLLALGQGAPLTQQALLWGAVAATGHCAGTLMLMRGLASGAMHVAGPLSAVCAAGLPVALGVALGERPAPLAVLGILLALPAVWAVAGAETDGSEGPDGPEVSGGSGRAGVRDGLLAGVGFAVFFVALARAGGGSGSWPVAVCQACSLVVMWGLVLVTGAHRLPGGSIRAALPAWVIGVTGSFGSVMYFLAGRTAGGGLTIVPVVTSLYPAFTVLLAMILLGERATRTQLLGLGACAVSVGLIAAG